MVGLVKLTGIAILCISTLYLVDINYMKKFVSFWMQGARIYLGVIINFIVGIVFLVSASQCSISWFIALIGVLAVAKAVGILFLGKERISSYCDKILNMPDKKLRLFSGVGLFVGAMIIYSI